MSVPYLIPVLIYASLALAFAMFSKRARTLKCVLVASYCGVIVTSFTGGASGGVWLAPLFLYLLSPWILFGAKLPAFGSMKVGRLTFALFVVFFVGILVGLVRYDPLLDIEKAGSFQRFMGVPTRVLMAGYRVVSLCSIVLAFMLPLRHRIDRPLLVQCLKLCWLFSLVLACLGIIDYLGLADMAFSYRREAGYGHVAILGFHRASLGMITVVGIFASFTLTQIAPRSWLTTLVYLSAPVLLLALLFSWSRAAMLAIGVGAVSLTFTMTGTRAIKATAITFCCLLIVGIMISLSPELKDRFALPTSGGLEESSAGRLRGWMQLVTWLVQSPGVLITGVGFQNFNYFVHLSSGAVELEAAHNNYLHILTEHGIFGFLIFIAWILAMLGWLLGWRRTVGDGPARVIPSIFLSLVLAIVVSCLTQESLAPSSAMMPFLLHFYLILGIWMSHYRAEMAQRSGLVG
ncbi:MAG: O-antigen ligase family protein [Phycisphaerae bacterium]